MTKNNQEFLEQMRTMLLDEHAITFYVTIETTYTTHYIERMANTCKDRGRIKWHAQTKGQAFEAINKQHDKEAETSVIDHADMFPRMYFHFVCFMMEFETWLNIRKLTITNIKGRIA